MSADILGDACQAAKTDFANHSRAAKRYYSIMAWFGGILVAVAALTAISIAAGWWNADKTTALIATVTATGAGGFFYILNQMQKTANNNAKDTIARVAEHCNDPDDVKALLA